MSCVCFYCSLGCPGEDGLRSTSQMVGCRFSVGRDRQRRSGQRRSASQRFHSHLRSVGHEFQSALRARGCGCPWTQLRSSPKHVPGWASWRSPSTLSERRSRSQFFEGSSPRRAGAVSGAPCGPAHRGDSGVHCASEKAHPGSPRRGDQSPGSCRCRDCKAS